MLHQIDQKKCMKFIGVTDLLPFVDTKSQFADKWLYRFKNDDTFIHQT
jgi:hypothetical protein